jgi:hypothetical protein
MLRTWRSRSSVTAGSSVGPSTPQFQLRLWLWPSRSFEEYLARLDWFGQEIIPATRAFGETPSAANAPVQQNA